MTAERLSTTDRIDTDAVEPVVRIGLAILAMAALLGLALLLPGTDWIVLEPAVSVADIVFGIGTLGIVAGLFYLAPRVRTLVSSWLQGPADVVASAAAVATYLVDFVAVLVAHQGFAPFVRPLLRPAWLYDAVFAVAALGLLAVIAYRFWLALDPITSLLTEKVAGQGSPSRMGEDRRV